MASTSQGIVPPDVREFEVRVPPNLTKRYSVMQFNRGDKVDFTTGVPVKMERENNIKLYKDVDNDRPTQGAGSEYGRERREEARRKKYGVVVKQYKEDDQPWILKMGGKQGKKYKGRKEGLMTENSSYYMFIQLPDKSFAAYPVDSFYNFMAMIQYKTLNAEEAEQEFLRRDRVYNHHSLMIQKRLKDGKDAEVETEEEDKKSKRKKLKTDNLTLTEDDEFRDLMTSGSDSSDEDEGDKKKKKKKNRSKKERKEIEKKKKKVDSEAEEESDEGDFDDREFDYISEESSDDQAEEERKIDIKGVDQEWKVVEEEEEEEKEEEEENKEEEAEPENKENTEKNSAKKEDDSSSNGSDSSDSDIDDSKIQSAMFLQNKSSKKSSNKSSPHNSNAPSRSNTPTLKDDGTAKTLIDAAKKLDTDKKPGSSKRPGTPLMDNPAAKRVKADHQQIPRARTPPNESGITEEVVRRYLMRKPMTTKDLLHKLNPKKLGLSLEEVVKRLTDVLRRLNPEQKKVKDKVYWFVQK